MKTMLLLVLLGSFGIATASEAQIRNRLNGIARKVSMEGHQITSMGITGTMVLTKPVTKEVPGNKFKVAYEWQPDGTIDGVLRGATGAKAVTIDDQTARPSGGASYRYNAITWRGKAWPMGRVKYRTAQGLARTCPLWTASEDEAMAFYRKHGFTQAAKDAVMVID